MSTTADLDQRRAGREHFPISVYSKRWYGLRIAQLIGAILCLSLAAYAAANWPNSSAAPLTIFTSLVTFIALGYYLIAQFSQPAAYNYWAVIALDAFLTTFWFISFVVLASEVFDDFAVVGGGDPLYSAQGLAAVTVFAAFECAWFASLLGLLARSVHRHRAAGLHSAPTITIATGVPSSDEEKAARPPMMNIPAVVIQPPPVYQPPTHQPYVTSGVPQPPQQPHPVPYQSPPPNMAEFPVQIQSPPPVQHMYPPGQNPNSLAYQPPPPNMADHPFPPQLHSPPLVQQPYPTQSQSPTSDVHTSTIGYTSHPFQSQSPPPQAYTTAAQSPPPHAYTTAAQSPPPHALTTAQSPPPHALTTHSPPPHAYTTGQLLPPHGYATAELDYTPSSSAPAAMEDSSPQSPPPSSPTRK